MINGEITRQKVKDIQTQLIDLRKSMNITQKELADMIGMSQQYVSKFERNDGSTADGIWSIANVLGYDLVLVKRVN